MLNPEFKKKWLEALRSGDYLQGQRYLCREIAGTKRYCCLGVAAEIDGVLEPQVRHDYRIYEATENGSINMYFPEGLSGKGAEELATMNDNGRTFLEIADYIEENY